MSAKRVGSIKKLSNKSVGKLYRPSVSKSNEPLAITQKPTKAQQ